MWEAGPVFPSGPSIPISSLASVRWWIDNSVVIGEEQAHLVSKEYLGRFAKVLGSCSRCNCFISNYLTKREGFGTLASLCIFWCSTIKAHREINGRWNGLCVVPHFEVHRSTKKRRDHGGRNSKKFIGWLPTTSMATIQWPWGGSTCVSHWKRHLAVGCCFIALPRPAPFWEAASILEFQSPF